MLEYQQRRRVEIGWITSFEELVQFGSRFPELVKAEDDPVALVRLLIDYLLAERRKYRLLASYSAELEVAEKANEIANYFSESLVGEDEKSMLGLMLTHVRHNLKLGEGKGETKWLAVWEKLDSAIMEVLAQMP